MQVLKDAIRQRIVTEALEVFLEKGYEKASMRDLAQRVGTSVSNIYHYFASKEELFHAVEEPIASRVKHLLVLMDKSGGTGYEKVKTEIISAVETHIIQHHLKDSKEAHHPKGAFLMHFLATNLIEALVEIARHCRDEKEVDHSILSLVKYHIGGMAHLMG
jgi:AcrR family transcriptional regulator